MRFLRNTAFALVFTALCFASLSTIISEGGLVRWAQAQGFFLPDGTVAIGKMRIQSGSLGPPTTNNGAVTPGSSDYFGSYVATAAVATTLTFSSAWSAAPLCTVWNTTTSSIKPSATASTTALTIGATGIGATNVIGWTCVGLY